MDLSGFLETNSLEWWSVLLAIIAIVAGWILSRFARRATASLLGRLRGVSGPLIDVSSRAAGWLVLLLGVGIALALLGANIQPVLAVVLAVAVIAALVLRGVAENFAAGVLIQTRRPVELGDEVVVLDGADEVLTGTVRDLNSRAVVVVTRDGRTAHVPNAALLRSVIVNDSTAGARRSEVQVRAERGGRTVEDVRATVEEAVHAVEGVTPEPEVRTLVTTVSMERVTLRAQFWHMPTSSTILTSDAVAAVAAALEQAGVTATVTSDAPPAPLAPPDHV